MEITLPETISEPSHGGIVKALIELNQGFTVPSRSQWPKYVPDLVHAEKRIAVEVELTDLLKAWGQCLSYYRLGAKEVHLVLPPKLFRQFERDEKSFIKKNPLPSIRVYELPLVEKIRGRPPVEKERTIMVTTRDPVEKFVAEENKAPYAPAWKEEVEPEEQGLYVVKARRHSNKPPPPSMLIKNKDARMIDSDETIVQCPSCKSMIPNTRYCLNCAHQLHPNGWNPH